MPLTMGAAMLVSLSAKSIAVQFDVAQQSGAVAHGASNLRRLVKKFREFSLQSSRLSRLNIGRYRPQRDGIKDRADRSFCPLHAFPPLGLKTSISYPFPLITKYERANSPKAHWPACGCGN